MRVARLIIYEGSEEDISVHLAQAKNDGHHLYRSQVNGKGINFRIITMPPEFVNALTIPDLPLQEHPSR